MLRNFSKLPRITRTIAFKLFLVITLAQTLTLLVLTIVTIRVQEKNLMDSVQMSGQRVSDVIARSMRYSMLLNRREDVHEIVSSVGGHEGIEDIRIYNKQGEVVFGTRSSDIHTKVDAHAEACVSCHNGNGLDHPYHVAETLSRIFTNAEGKRVLGLITPIRNEPQCANADCHAHPPEKTILGVLDVKMSLTAIDGQLADQRKTLLSISVATVLMIGLLSGIFIWLVVRRPVKRLMVGMDRVSTGDLGHHLTSKSRDELGQLAAKFNAMIDELDRARAEITGWSQTLEAKVREKTADLEKVHRQMVRVEKMASLGNLASSVAHELNNPLEGILTFARLLVKRIRKTSLPPEEVSSYCSDLTLVADEAQRCGNIVKNLLLFARQGGATFQTIQLKTIVDRCILLLNHHAQMRQIALLSGIEGSDSLECDPNQIQQTFIALIMNAIEAMAGANQAGGAVRISAVREGDAMAIRVSDNGPGMTDEVKAHIFEPFFTTKSEGKGVGLGLAIVFGIVERHHGSIEVESGVGNGTTFTMILPLKQPPQTDTRPAKTAYEGIRQ